MVREDVRAFSYLSNYLYNSCVKLQKANFSLKHIENSYSKVLQQLCIDHPPAPVQKRSGQELKVHQRFKDQQYTPYYSFNPEELKTDSDIQFGLQALIMNRAEQSLQQLDRFNSIIKTICQDNSGFNFKSGVKLKNREQTTALTRIKEKMLSSIYKDFKPNSFKRSQIKEDCLRNFTDIHSYASKEYFQYKQIMKKIFSLSSQPIPFKISDLLRGKCMFSSIEKINKCCQSIKDYIKNNKSAKLKLIEIDNRLSSDTSDLVLKILFGKTVAEVQLVKDHSTSDNEFNHKLYELKRSQFFSPLTQLSIFNEDISKEYLSELRSIILNNINQSNDYKQKIVFEESLKNFKRFTRLLEAKINFLEAHPNDINIQLMTAEQDLFRKLIRTKCMRHSMVGKLQIMSEQRSLQF